MANHFGASLHSEATSSEAIVKLERNFLTSSPRLNDNEEDRVKNYFLRWKGFEGNLIRMVEGLKYGSGLTDVTLSCEGGHKFHLHKLILASASVYFYQIFEDFRESKHPIIILSKVSADVLQLLVTYMYCGFIDVPNEMLTELISVGKSLKIKGLMDMKTEMPEDIHDYPLLPNRDHPPPAHHHSNASFMMSPLSEPRLTPTFPPLSYSSQTHMPLAPWPGAESLHLLATAAHMRLSSEEEDRSSSAEPSPQPMGEASGHSAISAIAASRTFMRHKKDFPYFRFDRENDENDPQQGPSGSSENSNQSLNELRSQEARAINLSMRASEPLATLSTNFSAMSAFPLLNIPNPNSFHTKRDESSSSFCPLVPVSAEPANPPSSGESSLNSSPLDYSSWRMAGPSDFSAQRLFSHDNQSAFTAAATNTQSPMEQDNSEESNRTALMAVAAALSAAAISAVGGDRGATATATHPPPAPPNTVVRRGPRQPRVPRRSSTGAASSSSRSKAHSPVGTGSNWKSRQPTECDFCKRMFSNKFNLKQHILNMHSTGGEVRCEQCGKLVKNKWYLRRHKVTHHGAPLRKYKKEDDDDLNPFQSDNEDSDPGCQLVIQQ